jgi:hypothetical protein
MLLGEDFPAEMAVFETYNTEFEMRTRNDLSGINTIVWLKKFELNLSKFFSESKDKGKANNQNDPFIETFYCLETTEN